MQHFVNDDEGYVAWLCRHPLGYVLNPVVKPRSTYLKLHEASCPPISTLQPTARFWTRAYGKTCSDEIEDLIAWSQSEAGGVPDRCPTCKP